MRKNCGVGEDSWESLVLQGDPTSPFWRSALEFLWRNDAKAETPVLWPPHVKSWLTGKDSDAGTDWGQEEKGTTEDEMAGWHDRLNAHEFGWTPGIVDGQESLACCDSRGCKESDTTERLNWTELNDNPVFEIAKETQMYRTVFWTLWERARVGWFGRMALKHVYYHMWNESKVQVWWMIQDARGWCTGMTQRDGMEMQGGGERFRMGNTCTPVADSCQLWQNQYNIVK